jgi:hypothetical protein
MTTSAGIHMAEVMGLLWLHSPFGPCGMEDEAHRGLNFGQTQDGRYVYMMCWQHYAPLP